MYRHILLPTDGSELALKGVEQGLRLAKQLDAKATALLVSVPLSGLAMEAAVEGLTVKQYGQLLDEEAARVASSVSAMAAEAGLPVDFVRKTNASPAEQIVETAGALGCDLIVMASHGRRGIRRLMLGSQTYEVLAASQLPVLVVR